MNVYCAVPGCSSNSKTTDYTFHRFPRNVITRARWILALRRPVSTLGSCAQVCGRHFEEIMFSDRRHVNSRGLAKNAVPTLYLPPKQSAPITRPAEDQLKAKLPKVDGSRPDITEHLVEAASTNEVLACRVCLATDGRLYAISGSGLEDALAALTGVAMPEADSLPRHLCVFCRAKLSKCAAFRDSCQRTTALLQTLLEKGPLITISDIESVDRHKHKLTNTLTRRKLYYFQAHPFWDMMPLSKDRVDSQQVPDYTEVEYLESDGGVDNTEDDKNKVKFETIKVELKIEDSDAHSEVDDATEYKAENVNNDGDTDTLEETVATVKKGNRKRVKLEKENTGDPRKYKYVKTKVDDYPTDIDTDASEETIEMREIVKIKKLLPKENCTKTTKSLAHVKFTQAESIAALEKEYDCKIKLLSKEEQKWQVEERKRNNKSDYCCDLCGKGHRNANTLERHLSFHNPSFPHECDACRLRFGSRRQLRKHQNYHRAIYTCNQCGLISQTRWLAKAHYLMHKGKTYTCPYCQAVYDHSTSYYNHVRMQHPGQYEACDLCGETFAAGRGVTLHKALAHRTNAKPNVDLECSACEVTFLSAEALRRHAELSAGAAHAGLWPCARCGRACRSPHALATHAAEQHPPQQLTQHHCEECNKTFLNAESFALHADRKHRNRRAAAGPFRRQPPAAARPASCVCELCGKLLQNSTLLQYHMNGHLDVKPFQCPHCPKAFTHRTALNLHMRVHTGERPYQCEQCPQAFALQCNFSRHVKTVHLQQRKLVKCQVCGKVLTSAALALHVRSVHQNQKYVRRKRDRTKKQLVTDTES